MLRKGIPEGIGACTAAEELFREDHDPLCGRKHMQGHASPHRYWGGEALEYQAALGPVDIQSYGVEMQKVPRADNASDMLTHLVGELELPEGLGRMKYHTPGECLGTFVTQ